jgi:hypothetical protein
MIIKLVSQPWLMTEQLLMMLDDDDEHACGILISLKNAIPNFLWAKKRDVL